MRVENLSRSPEPKKTEGRSKRWRLAALAAGGAITTVMLAGAACGGKGESQTPNPTEPAPSPTPNVPLYDFEERDAYYDGNINMLDYMEQSEGRNRREFSNFDSNFVVDATDVLLARRLIKPGEYNKRADLNFDGKNDEADLQVIIDNFGDVLSNGEFRADAVERGWVYNNVGVRFEPGTKVEKELSELVANIQSDEDVQKLKEIVLSSLGLNQEWEIEAPYDPDEGFTVTLVVPESVLKNVTLGGVIDMIEQKGDVLEALRIHANLS